MTEGSRGPEEVAPSGGTTHRLVVEGLRASVAGREVLTGVDLQVASHEVHAIMGPNGSGKSTLSNVLMGRPGYSVTAGSVTLDGQDLLALAPWERARLGLFLAPQYPTEVPGVALRQVLIEALAGRGGGRTGGALVDGSEVGVMLDAAASVGLAPAMVDRAVNVDLSGGERKRSETMQLVLLRPSVAVLDELDSGLDVDGLRAVARRVRHAVDDWGLGVLAITHYQRLLAELRPDVVHVLVGGRIVRRGGAEVADELEHSGYGADLLSADPTEAP